MAGVRLATAVLAWLSAQDAGVVIDVLGDRRDPAPVSCGLVDARIGPGLEWRPVRLEAGPVAIPGVVVRRPFGAAVRATLPARAGGRGTAFRIVPGRAEALPASRLLLDHGEGVFESGELRAALTAEGGIEVGGLVCELHPVRPRDGCWTARGADPVRAVAVWSAAGAPAPDGGPVALYAVFHAGSRCVDLTLVLRGGAGGAGSVLGLAFRGADEAPQPAEEEPGDAPAPGEPVEEPTPPPPFEAVLADVQSSIWDELLVGRNGGGVARVRRVGPAAPAMVDPSLGATRLLLAREPWDAAPEPRVLRVRLGGRTGDAWARPARFPASLPGGGRFAPPSARPELVRVRRKLDAAIAALRSDPRHGLLHLRDDLGDWRMDPYRVGNLEWDTALGFLLRFLDAGGRADACQALLGVEHLLLRDRDPESGLFFQHGARHQSGVIEAGHHWAEGVAAVASWLDDPWLLDECAHLSRDQVCAFGRLDLPAALPRSLGWALTALCALHDFAPDRDASRAAIARIERFVLGRQTESGLFAIEPASAREGAFRVSPFVDGGILLPALERARLVTGNRAGREAVRRARAALLREAVVVEEGRLRLVSSILADGRTGRVAGRGGWADGEEILLFLSGIGSGADVERDLLLLAEESLLLERRTYLGKPVSMLMRALPAYAAGGG